MDVHMKPYVGKLCYPDRQPFFFGTVLVPLRAPQHEVERALMQEYAEIMPLGCELPLILEVISGSLILVNDEEI